MLRINVELGTPATAIFGVLACLLHIFGNFTLEHVQCLAGLLGNHP